MNLQQVAELKNLYPPVRTRSGQEIKTTELASKLDPKGGTLAVTVKTVFPPSDRRRTELSVTSDGRGAFVVTPHERPGLTDAMRFAELLRERCLQDSPDEPLGPLRLIKAEGHCAFAFAPAAAAASTENGAS